MAVADVIPQLATQEQVNQNSSTDEREVSEALSLVEELLTIGGY